MTDMMRLDIQRVQWIMENCLANRPCTSRTTKFYVVGNRDPEYNITIAYPPSTSPRTSNALFSFLLSTDVLELNLTTCIEHGEAFITLRTYGPIRLSEVVIHANVVIDATGRLHMNNSRLVSSGIMSIPVNLYNEGYISVLQMLETFIDDQC
uniref:GMC_OxRdtase_N domain-containing protein n=1 Tax=Mesocestoides corti TaxID=53468 RepID=A0A5K3FK79_MESCO